MTGCHLAAALDDLTAARALIAEAQAKAELLRLRVALARAALQLHTDGGPA